MTALYSLLGMDVRRMLTALSPDQFADACREILAEHSGEEAHHRLDHLVTTLLNNLGYSEGMAIFLAAVGPVHGDEE